MLRFISIVLKGFHFSITLLCSFYVAFAVTLLLSQPSIGFNQGQTISTFATDQYMIHELFPNSSWNDLEPCGLHFNEQEEFNKALQCVNTKVWPKTPLVKEEFTHIPRCFVVKAHSPDVYTSPKAGFNFWPIFETTPFGVQTGAVVGVYQPETRTVYIVENVDAAMVYRHELQHYFLHEHNPETGGGGHHQTIWEKCEPPYYTPSDKVKPKVTPTPTSQKAKNKPA